MKPTQRVLVLVSLVAAAAGVIALFLRGGDPGLDGAPLTGPPAVDVEGVDPAVVAAIDAARRLVAAAPADADAWGNLAMVLLAHDVFASAVTCFREAARRDAGEARWPYLEALALLKGDPDPHRAVPRLERAVAIGRDDPVPRLKLAETLLEQGRIEAARRAFLGALELEHESARAHLGLGRAAYLSGDLDRARDHLTRAARSAPQVRTTHELLAEVCFRAGDAENAARERSIAAGLAHEHFWPDPHFQQVLERWVGALARIERASDTFQRGRRAEAIRFMEKTVELHPGALLAHLVLGRFLVQADRPEEAERALVRAVALAPEAFEAHHELGIALERQGKYAHAMARFERSIAIKPSYAASHFHLAQCRLRQGDQAGALAALQATVRFKPDYAEAQRALGHLLALSGRYREAAGHLQHAVRLDPEDAKARLLLEHVLSRDG